jgi:hypothetical protein
MGTAAEELEKIRDRRSRLKRFLNSPDGDLLMKVLEGELNVRLYENLSDTNITYFQLGKSAVFEKIRRIKEGEINE